MPPTEGEDPRFAEARPLVTTPDRATTPRERARVDAMHGCLAFGRLLYAVALVEVVAATVRAIVDPDPSPAVLGHLAGFTRTAYAVLAVLFAGRFVPLARAFGMRSLALGAGTFFALSALAALLPFFAIVPESLDDATWDALLQIVRSITFVAGASMTLLVARALAEREAQPQIARHLAWTLVPLLATVPVAFQAIAPTLLPSPWLGPGLALALPVVMAVVGLMRWDVAVWSLLGLVALGGTVLFQPDPGTLTLPALALTGVLALAAVSASGSLHELAPVFETARSDTISRTLIRRLFDGTLGGESSRVGDLDADASKPPTDEKAEDAEQLARTLRELGIESPARISAMDPLPLPSVIQPLVPKSRSSARPEITPVNPTPPDSTPATSAPVVNIDQANHSPSDDGRLAPVVVLPVAWTGMDRGLRWCFAAFLARVIVVTFGLMWSSSPLGDLGPAVLLFDLALITSSVVFARGLYLLWHSPIATLRAPATLAITLGTGLVLADLASFVLRTAGLERTACLAIDALLGIATVAVYLVVLMRLATHLRQPKLRTRARGSLLLLSAWSVFAVGTAIANHLPASDLQWLSWPLGFATAAVGLGLWIALLWLTHDTREALRP